MFCRNCGKELTGSPEICLNCGAKPMSATSFCPDCGAPTTPLTEICVKCGTRVTNISPKSRLAVSLLAWFLGIFGAHRFYLGKIGTAVAMLLLSIVGWSTIWFFGIGLVFLIPVSIWAFVDFIFAVIGRMKDKEDKVIQNW